jgi:hypothetical protein
MLTELYRVFHNVNNYTGRFIMFQGVVCGPRGAHLAGRCVPVKIWEIPFIPAKSDACMSSS